MNVRVTCLSHLKAIVLSFIVYDYKHLFTKKVIAVFVKKNNFKVIGKSRSRGYMSFAVLNGLAQTDNDVIRTFVWQNLVSKYLRNLKLHL